LLFVLGLVSPALWQETGWEERLWNNVLAEWDINLNSVLNAKFAHYNIILSCIHVITYSASVGAAVTAYYFITAMQYHVIW